MVLTISQFFCDVCTYIQNKFTCSKEKPVQIETESAEDDEASTSSQQIQTGKPNCGVLPCAGGEFEEELEKAGNLLVVVDFFATWCGPCKVIGPRLEEMAERYKEKIVVLKVDVDECEELAMRYNISSMPTFVFIKNNEVLDSFSGANADKLEKYIIQHSN